MFSLSPALCVLLAGLSSISPAVALDHPASYAEWAANSAISRGQGNGLSSSKPSVSYEHGEFWWGLQQLYERGGNQSYYDYIVNGVNNIVTPNGTVIGGYNLTAYALDPLRTGPAFLYLYNQTGDSRYKIAAETYRSQLYTHPRTPEGQFWHKLIYPEEGWLDGIYMGDMFYAQYTHDLDANNSTAWDDIALQFNVMFAHTIQNATAPNNTGLLYHGYDYSKKAIWASPDRGHSPEVWDRALGWYFMSLVDIISIFPQWHPGYASFLEILQQLAPKLRDAADAQTGVWWLVMTQPGRTGNYFESSGSSMFVYALLKAVRLGYVQDPDGSIVAAATKAYQYMTNNWVVDNHNGTFNWLNTVVVGSLDTTGDFEYYISQPVDVNDLKGLGAFLLASLEYERL